MGQFINFKSNFPAFAKRLEALPDQIADRALVRAMNATVEQGKIEMARQISSEFRISVSEVKSRLSIGRATVNSVNRFEARLEATQRGKGRSMNLIAFVTGQQRRLKSGKLQQIKFQIKRDGGRKVLPGAFIGNDGRTVFIRTGKARLPIKAVNTIDVQQMFNTKRINSVVVSVMLERLTPNLERELRVVLGGFAK